MRLADVFVFKQLHVRPSANISLRTVDPDAVKVLKVPEMVLIDEIDPLHAIWEIYEGAIFLHQGDTYLIRMLDLAAKVAHAQLVAVDYFTKCRDVTSEHNKKKGGGY